MASTVVGTDVESEEAGTSCINFSPVQTLCLALSNLKGATQRSEVLPTTASIPVSDSVEFQLSAGEEQVILHFEPSEEDSSGVLALPQALSARQHWTTKETNLPIRKACSKMGNRACHQCRKKFSSTRQLRRHAPQHFVSVFCSCDKCSYQCDYVMCHQHIARCHMGHTFVVDETMFPEFRDLILPHLGDPPP